MSPQRSQGRILPAIRAGTVLIGASALLVSAVPAVGGSGGTRTAASPPPVARLQQAATPDETTPDITFSTYLGGLEWDEPGDVEVDDDGNVYVTGFTLSKDFPTEGRDALGPGGIVDAFVSKLSEDGDSLVWSVVLGGTNLDMGNGLALDDDGNVYVVGRTGSDDFPTENALQDALAARDCTGEPCHDAFVAKLSGDGELVYSTYLGGSRNEEGLGIAVDSDGQAHVTGNTDSLDFPTEKAFQDKFGSLPCEGDVPCPYDTFASTLSSEGDQLVFSTYLGGKATDIAGGIAVDENGSTYVTGSTSSEDFPTTDDAVQASVEGTACGPPAGTGCPDAFVTKLSTDGSAALYSTLLGGERPEAAGGVAVDDEGRAVVTGSTQSSDFPTMRAVQSEIDNESCTSEQPEEFCSDGFAARIDADGSALDYATYLGGNATDEGLAVALDEDGNAFVAGRTDSRTFPVREAVQEELGGYIDGFVAKLTADDGALAWNTFLGGAKADRATGVTVSTDGAVHVTGRTLSTDFPTKSPLQDELQNEDYDVFVTTLR